MAFILDSNVISELWKPQPATEVVRWLQSVEWLVPVAVIAEIQEGAEAASSLGRRAEITRRLDDFLREFPSLVLDWDAETARVWARLRHSNQVKRQPQSLWDSLIDAMGIRYEAQIASRNFADFRHSTVFDPWTGQVHNPGEG